MVYGLFGLGAFVIFLNLGVSMAAGALTLAIMTMPVVISASEEALRAVPQAFRVVNYSLGGTRWQGIRRIVLPQALPGIMTGVILGIERAAGETAPILFTAAVITQPGLPDLYPQPCHGAALPPVYYLHPGTWNAREHAVWYRPGIAGFRSGVECNRHLYPLSSTVAQAMVTGGIDLPQSRRGYG